MPPDKILQRTDNPTGRAVVCWTPQRGIMCFVRATEFLVGPYPGGAVAGEPAFRVSPSSVPRSARYLPPDRPPGFPLDDGSCRPSDRKFFPP